MKIIHRIHEFSASLGPRWKENCKAKNAIVKQISIFLNVVNLWNKKWPSPKPIDKLSKYEIL